MPLCGYSNKPQPRKVLGVNESHRPFIIRDDDEVIGSAVDRMLRGIPLPMEVRTLMPDGSVDTRIEEVFEPVEA